MVSNTSIGIGVAVVVCIICVILIIISVIVAIVVIMNRSSSPKASPSPPSISPEPQSPPADNIIRNGDTILLVGERYGQYCGEVPTQELHDGNNCDNNNISSSFLACSNENIADNVKLKITAANQNNSNNGIMSGSEIYIQNYNNRYCNMVPQNSDCEYLVKCDSNEPNFSFYIHKVNGNGVIRNDDKVFITVGSNLETTGYCADDYIKDKKHKGFMCWYSKRHKDVDYPGGAEFTIRKYTGN